MFNFIKKWWNSPSKKALRASNEALFDNCMSLYNSFMQLKNMDDVLFKAICLQQGGRFLIEKEFVETAETDHELFLSMDEKDGVYSIVIEKVKKTND